MKKLIKRINTTILAFLRKWLGIEQQTAILLKQSQEIEAQRRCISDLETKMNILMSVTKVGVDVNPTRYGPSWAVVCLNGKDRQYMDFFELNPNDIRHIQEFLRHFDRKNRTIDAPRGMERWFM